ncbi:MAG: hypothetical protein ABIO77_08530 [Ginsengibacter sp.]
MVVYILLALPINIIADIIGDFHKNLPDLYWLQVNIYLYNIHSVIRFVCFSYFFIQLRQEYYSKFKKIIPILYLLFLVIDLGWFENFFSSTSIGSHLFLVEAFLLMTYCLLYYLSKARDDQDEFTSTPDIYVVTGLSIFVVTNFFVYLYYDSMMQSNHKMADDIWIVPNVAYVILCLFIAKAFTASKSKIGRSDTLSLTS